MLESSDSGVAFARTNAPRIERSAVHVQIETPVELEVIRALADEHALTHGLHRRGARMVYEVWIEPGFLVEFVV